MSSDQCWRSIRELHSLMNTGQLTSRELVCDLLGRVDSIDRSGPMLRSIIETNPEAERIAAELDAMPAARRGRLHGIPILLKDNICTADGMNTTAGSLALEPTRPRADAFVARRIREAGGIILGKANMSEWANFRSTHSSSGWSARGGQCRNPYALDRSPCGSSSGSAAAVAAGLAPVSLGTETDGSILCPGAMCGVVGIKPTVGLTSRSGVIPISHSQDTVGPFARTVEDAAIVLSAIVGHDPTDSASSGQPRPDYTTKLDPNALRGARIGVPRKSYFGYSQAADSVVENAITAMRDAGAEVIDPADFPSAEKMKSSKSELAVLLYEFKAGINQYLEQLSGEGPRTLQDLIAFNQNHVETEMPFFGQELFLMAEEKGDLAQEEYISAAAETRRLGREDGIDAVLAAHQLDALVMPTTGPAFTIDLSCASKKVNIIANPSIGIITWANACICDLPSPAKLGSIRPKKNFTTVGLFTKLRTPSAKTVGN